jgi:DNA-binding NarL/FixJ family response regulator
MGREYGSAVRQSRAIHVEDDPALRAVFREILTARAELEFLGSYGSASDALADPQAARADIALLDLDLGPHSLNGIELGLLLRERNPNMGIAIFTQHVVPDFVGSLPDETQWGWSFIEKRSDLDIDQLVDVMRATAKGLNVVDPGIQRARTAGAPSVIDELTMRQREILALAATGLDATAIADELGFSPVTVRQDLSKAYAVLVPDPKKGTDLRTSAVLRYLRESRNYATPYPVGARDGYRKSSAPMP